RATRGGGPRRPPAPFHARPCPNRPGLPGYLRSESLKTADSPPEVVLTKYMPERTEFPPLSRPSQSTSCVPAAAGPSTSVFTRRPSSEKIRTDTSPPFRSVYFTLVAGLNGFGAANAETAVGPVFLILTWASARIGKPPAASVVLAVITRVMTALFETFPKRSSRSVREKTTSSSGTLSPSRSPIVTPLASGLIWETVPAPAAVVDSRTVATSMFEGGPDANSKPIRWLLPP